jgi:glycosyltransferase involved in cell wall biosynthesis
VVSTSKGAEGIELLDGEHILIGESNEEFAGNVIRLLRDQDLRQRIINQARKRLCEKYAWEVVMPRFESLVQRTATI